MRVVLHSQQPVLAKGFATVAAGVPDLTLVAISTDLSRLPELLSLTEADVLLVDWSSQMTLHTLAAIQAQNRACRIVLWVHSIAPELASQVMRLGIHGILCKTASLEVTVQVLMKVADGQHWFEQAITQSVLETTSYSLTRRESDLVNLVSQGLKNKEIAHALNISEGTIKVYLSKLFRKIGVKDRYELALQGLKNSVDVHQVSDAPRESLGSVPEFFAKRAAAGVRMARRPYAG